ncbi:MAG: ATP-binding protein [Pseudomonadota bacterium]
MEKRFKFDVILNEQDLCDREAEKKRLISLMERGGRVVIYSPRRMGKTSLAMVCSEKLRSKHTNAFCLYVDLNEAETLAEVAHRFRAHYEYALREQFPIQNAKMLLGALLSRIKLSLPGGIELALERYTTEKPEHYLMSLMSELDELSAKQRVVLIIDEFQGIANQREAQAILRREFQRLSRAAVVLMGSNQRLLYRMFNDKELPFFGFGEDMELKGIPIKEYLPYMNERFAGSNIHISEDVALFMAEIMNDIPNYINELGAWIVDTMENLELTKEHIGLALEAAAQSKRGRYESALYGYTANQRALLRAIARLKRGVPVTGNEMQEFTGLSATELSRSKTDLEDCPLLSHDTSNRIFISDPFLKKFLEMQ